MMRGSSKLHLLLGVLVAVSFPSTVTAWWGQGWAGIFAIFRDNIFYRTELCQGQACNDVNSLRRLQKDGRTLQQEEDDKEYVAKMMKYCATIPYQIELVMTKKEGHFMFYAEPAIPTTILNMNSIDSNDNDNEDLECEALLAHVMMIDKDETNPQLGYHVIKHIQFGPATNTDQLEAFRNEHVISYKMDGNTRYFGEIMDAITSINVDEYSTMTYSNSAIPANCGTFLIEVAKLLHIPIDDDVIHFVVSNVATTTQMKDFATNPIYQMFHGSDNEGANNNVVHGILKYMLEQQYRQ